MERALDGAVVMENSDIFSDSVEDGAIFGEVAAVSNSTKIAEPKVVTEVEERRRRP